MLSMDLDHHEDEDDDPFLVFIDYASSILSPDELQLKPENHNPNEIEDERILPGWSWIASRILKTCIAYSSGVTPAILLSDLSQAWTEQRKSTAAKKRPDCVNELKKKHRRTKLPNTVSIDSIYEKNFLSFSSVLEAVVVNAFVLPGTNIYILTLGDFWSSNTIDLYLHRRYYDLVNPHNGILKKGREVFLTGCYLRTASEGSGYTRLLPTEYLAILLDMDQDDDAMLLGAQFCSDSFSSITLDAVNQGVSYSLYARIESVTSVDIQGNSSCSERKQITLIDNEGMKLKFLLWGDQVVLANMLSIGSMLALDKPFIESSAKCSIETDEEVCLEYGSETQLYLVPYIPHEEQVCVASTQQRYQGPRVLSSLGPSQGPKVSQLTLLRDSEGSIDFSNYPFRSFVIDLHDKMTSISLYGVVTDICREKSTADATFSVRIEDTTGEIWAKLHFDRYWSLGRLGLGHTVFISGLTCCTIQQNCFEVSWSEKDSGASFINLSCLPAFLNSSCLHKLSCLSSLSSQTRTTHVCQVWLDQIGHYDVDTRFCHALCGHFVNRTLGECFECSFCHYNCDAEEVMRTFHLKITLVDESSKIFAWCTGQTATELLQISPDEFYELPEDEQIMYFSSLADKKKFMVSIVNCKRGSDGISANDELPRENDGIIWEITRALKCE